MDAEGIRLDRRFVRSVDNAAGDVRWADEGFNRALSWESVGTTRCNVILGEAGAGKTFELRMRAAELRAQGQTAFCVPVHALATLGLRTSLGPDERPKFDEALTADGDIWLFLDSVEESELRGNTLHGALSMLADDMEHRLKSLRLTLSARGSDWQEIDQQTLNAFVKSIRFPASEHVEVEVLHLLALTTGQVQALAILNGVEDPEGFVKAAHQTNAWPFLSRPLDVVWLSRYWSKHGSLGTLTQLVEGNIDERIGELQRPASHLHLSPERARVGARALALATRLSDHDAIAITSAGAERRGKTALDPHAVLTGWRPAEVRELLSRGLFDDVTYGRVRIHHRIAHDYLAAEALYHLVRDGFPLRDARALLFQTAGTRLVIPRHLTGVVAWLAAWMPEVRQVAVQCGPEHLLDEGDPAALPVTIRRAILRSFRDRYADRERFFLHFDRAGLQRFASGGLNDDLRGLLASKEPKHVRELALDVIKGGRLSELAGNALALALSTKDTALRYSAAAAVLKAGSEHQRRHLLRLLDPPAGADPDLVTLLLSELYPESIATADAVLAMVRAKRRPNVVTGLEYALVELATRGSRPERKNLVAELLDAMLPIGCAAATHTWLASPLASALASLADEQLEREHLDRSCIIFSQLRHDTDAPLDLARLLREPRLRRAIFWHFVAEQYAASGNYPMRPYDTKCYEVFALSSGDKDWLLRDFAGTSDPKQRALALNTASRLIADQLTSEAEAEFASIAARLSPNLSHLVKVHLERRRRRQMPSQPYHAGRLELLHAHHKSRRAARERVERIQSAIEELRSGQASGMLWELLDRHSMTDALTAIAEQHGEDIANATREGAMAFASSAEPVPIENFPANRSSPVNQLGLTGADFLFAQGVVVDRLPESMLRRCIMFATARLNGFPAWLAKIADQFPLLLAELFEPAMRLDYALPPADPQNHAVRIRLLRDISGAALCIRAACSDIVWKLLSASDPPCVEVLDACLLTLRGTKHWLTSEMRALARMRARKAVGAPQRLGAWWSAWLELDASVALSFVEHALERRRFTERARHVILVAPWMRAARMTRHEVPGWLAGQSQLIAKLYGLLRRYISQGQDLPLRGVHNDRHHAQEFRDVVFRWLIESPGNDTVKILDDLADASSGVDRDWFRHQAEMRAVQDASLRALSTDEVVKLLRENNRSPANLSDLFQTVLNRLDDVADELRNGDFSLRELLLVRGKARPERLAQLLVASQLQALRRTHYVVTRESEVVDQKRPDLLVSNPSAEGGVTIELKIADSWSLPQLESALRDQLVGRYMRANGSRAGVLLIVSASKSKRWGRQKYSFAELAEHLRARARRIVAGSTRISLLAVVDIALV